MQKNAEDVSLSYRACYFWWNFWKN